MSNTTANQWKSQQTKPPLIKKLLPYVFSAIIPIALFILYFYPFPKTPAYYEYNQFSDSHITSVSSASSSSQYSPSSTSQGKESRNGVLQPPLISPKENASGNGVLQPPSISPKENENENGNGVVPPSSISPEASVNEILQPPTTPAKGNGSGNIPILPQAKSNKTPSSCDYTNGGWVRDSREPLYNDTNCGTIKYGRNCLAHGRPDKGYLHWRWQPRDCNLSKFYPQSLLQILKGKHLAFVGDSMARNQLESLICMLSSSSASPPTLVYSKGEDNKFRRWHFPSHNVNVSIYWSPFLVKGIEKEGDQDYNTLYLDSVDEKWGSDLDSIDMVVLSIGHWYLLRAIYYDGGSKLGCHGLERMDCTEIGFYGVLGKALGTTLKAIVQRKGVEESNGIDVIVTTFSPHHFEGEWDKFGACPRTNPYKEEEKVVEGMDAEMRRVEVEEVKRAKAMLDVDDNSLSKIRVEVLDVTKLALLRPDGHPGPYMHPLPFANGIKERVQNDCVHWCLPGPIDTWNEILLDIMKRWHASTT